MMNTQDELDVYPLVDYWFPDFTPEEKKAADEALRPFVIFLTDAFLRWREQRQTQDSRESESHDTLESDKSQI
jgi:hypothetical protein